MLRFPTFYAAWLGAILAGLVIALVMLGSGIRKLNRSQKIAKELSILHQIEEDENPGAGS